jgi:HAMP domain-containing protein
VNIVLDTLSSARSFRWLGHALGLGLYLALTAVGAGGELAWTVAIFMVAALVAVEAAFGLFNAKARKLKALAPAVFPLKKMEAAERAFVQESLGRLPHRAVQRSMAAWVLAAALLKGFGLTWAGLALIVASGAFASAFTHGLGAAVMLKRVLPFFYFEDGYAKGFKAWLPSLDERFSFSVQLPLFIVLPPLAALVALGQPLGLGVLGVLALAGFAAAAGVSLVLKALVAEPVRDLQLALSRFGGGDMDALLDVTAGDALGEATESFNKSLRAVDRRLFILEKFGHAVLPGRSEGVLEGLRLDGELRPVALLAVRWLNAEACLAGLEPRQRLATLSRFYEAAQDAIDKAQGCTFELGEGGVVAVWGAPFAGELAVHGALGAAWTLGAALPVFARQQALRGALEPQWSIAVSSGQAVAGLCGPKGRERYQVQGGPLNELRRLAERPGGPWLDERSCASARSPFAVQVLGEGALLCAGPHPETPTAEMLGFSPGERL